MSASAAGSTVYLTAKTTGASTNYAFSSSSTYDSNDFGGPSFTSGDSGSALTGGTNPVPTYDSGNVWVTVNGFQASVNYGQGSTAASVASAIAGVFNNNGSSPVTAVASGSILTLTATTTGSDTNYSLSSGSQTTEGSFSSPSFTVSTSGANLTGGGNASFGNIYYYFDDMLGSSRTLVQAGQSSPCFDADYYPFGGERDIVATCPQNYKFEGKERDSETQNDDFGARYYSSRVGRWLSADWSAIPTPVPYANLSNPQTLNLYAMVSDNPETFADLVGHQAEGVPEGEDAQETNDLELRAALERAAEAEAGEREAAQKRAAEPTPEQRKTGWDDQYRCYAPGSPDPYAPSISRGPSKQDGANAPGPYSNLPDPPSVGPGKPFTPTQKSNIYDANMAKNGGVIRSDLSGQELIRPQQSRRGVTPPANEAQIDHIQPRNPSNPTATRGSNSYSNAEVLARTENNVKSNKEPQ